MLPQMNLKGFRPGKVPVAHVRRMYGKALMSEVIEQTLNETTQKVLDDNKLRPAAQPDLQPSSDMDAVLAGGTDLSYDLSVEIMPEFEPLDVATLKLTRPIYEPSDAEVDEALGELAKQSRTYEPKTAKTAKAKDGDQLLIDFLGRLDGEAFEGGTAEGAELVIGSGQFIPGFEEQLVGAKADSDVVVKVKFPENYQAANLAGKDAEFEVKVREIRSPVDGEANDALAERLGLENLEALKTLLKQNLGKPVWQRLALQAEACAAGRTGQGPRLPAAAAHGRRRVRRHLESGPAGQDLRQPAAGRTPRNRKTPSRTNTARSPSAACVWVWCWPRSAAPTTSRSPSRN